MCTIEAQIEHHEFNTGNKRKTVSLVLIVK